MLFKLAIGTEKTAEEFYSGLAEKFSHLPEISTFWLTLADDEKHHAQELEKIQDSLSPSQLSTPADPLTLQKAKQNRHISVLSLLNSVKNLNDAYEIAHQLEYSEVNVVFGFLMTRFISSEQQKEFVGSEIKVHQARLLEFFQTFGGAEWRKGIEVSPEATAVN